MFYGIEQSTDLRCRNTIIKKFSTKNALLKWMNLPNTSGRFTYADPEGARNYHHSFRYGYDLKGRIDKKDPIFKDYGTSTYPKRVNDQIASYLYKYASEIKD